MNPLQALFAEGAALRDLLKAARRLRADHPVVAGLHELRASLPEEHRHHVDALLAQHGPASVKVPKAPTPKVPGSRRAVMARNGTWGQEAAHHQRVIASPSHSPEHKALHQTALDAHEAVISHIVQHGDRKGDKVLGQKKHDAWVAGNHAHGATRTRGLGRAW